MVHRLATLLLLVTLVFPVQQSYLTIERDVFLSDGHEVASFGNAVASCKVSCKAFVLRAFESDEPSNIYHVYDTTLNLIAYTNVSGLLVPFHARPDESSLLLNSKFSSHSPLTVSFQDFIDISSGEATPSLYLKAFKDIPLFAVSLYFSCEVSVYARNVSDVSLTVFVISDDRILHKSQALPMSINNTKKYLVPITFGGLTTPPSSRLKYVPVFSASVRANSSALLSISLKEVNILGESSEIAKYVMFNSHPLCFNKTTNRYETEWFTADRVVLNTVPLPGGIPPVFGRWHERYVKVIIKYRILEREVGDPLASFLLASSLILLIFTVGAHALSVLVRSRRSYVKG